MEQIKTIEIFERQERGKQAAKRLRRLGRIPAVVYGGEADAEAVAVTRDALKAVLKSEMGGNSILRYEAAGKTVDMMVKEVQYDYLGDNIVHADFIRTVEGKSVDVWVPVKVSGEPVGVKQQDGIFDFMTRKVHLRCLPHDIPVAINLDVTELHAGESIHVSDLPVDPQKIEFVSDAHTVICMVQGKAGSDEEAEGDES